MQIPPEKPSFKLCVDPIISEVEPEFVRHKVFNITIEEIILRLHEFYITIGLAKFPVVPEVNVGPLTDSISVGNILNNISLIIIIRIQIPR